MSVNQKIVLLRQFMAERKIDVYIVPTADFHESEYVGEYFKARKFITGFTGSAGIAVITMKESGLWTDGRYFIQAEHQLSDSEVKLYKMGVEGVPTVNEYVKTALPEGGCIGFDGRVINAVWGQQLKEISEEKKGSLHVTEDLINYVWKGRPVLSTEPAWILEEKYSGENTQSKLSRIRQVMKEKNADIHIMTSLDDICWTLNIRGNDATHFPIVLGYLSMTENECVWYVNEFVLDDSVKTYLAENHITVASYEGIYAYADSLSISTGHRVLLDESKVNFRIVHAVSQGAKIINETNPALLMKAKKNPVEVENIRKAHVKDGVAMVKWLYWLKNTVGKETLTEISVSDQLAQFRSEQENFLDVSFGTIAGYEANGAMMHYSATPENYATLEPKGLLLVDSGGHYKEGSTDITRTIALGPITNKQKELFTVVLRSNLNLAAAKFLYGCNGQTLDILSRGPLWDLGIDYRCGTGHGVGYLLNIHEAPNGFRWRAVAERNDRGIFEEGMVTTDEPGVYLEGEFGIRSENELICHKDEKNEYGQFMSFETVTYCPFDLDCVNPDEMTQRERGLLNSYHKMVFETLSPYLNEDEKAWLKENTREI